MCVAVHQSPISLSLKYLESLRRNYYITPKSYLDLIGLYLELLGEKQEAEQKAKAPPEPALTPEQKKAQEVAQHAMGDPEVREILQDPKIQSLLQNMQSGVSFELERAMRSDPEVVRKLKKLTEAGLINMHWER